MLTVIDRLLFLTAVMDLQRLNDGKPHHEISSVWNALLRVNHGNKSMSRGFFTKGQMRSSAADLVRISISRHHE